MGNGLLSSWWALLDRYYLLGEKYWWWTIGISLSALCLLVVLALSPSEMVSISGFLYWISLLVGHHYTIYMLKGTHERGGIERDTSGLDKVYLLTWSLIFLWAMPGALFGLVAVWV